MREKTGAVLLACVAIALAFAACNPAVAAGIGGGTVGGGGRIGNDLGGNVQGGNRSNSNRPLKYYILQVMGASGDVTFDVVGDSEYAELVKNYKEEYKTGALDWAKAKREASKNRQEFTEKKPAGPRIMQKLSSSFKKEEEAKALADKYQEKWNERLEKKQSKEEAKANG